MSENYEELKQRVKEGKTAIMWLPKEYRDKETCFEAVKHCGLALSHVPEEHKDKELCLIAVRNYGRALEFAPVSLRDREMCMTAVKNHGLTLRDVPEHVRDFEMYLEAVKQTGIAIMYVPKDVQTREMCVSRRDDNVYYMCPEIMWVNDKFKDREMYLKHAKKYGDTHTDYIPNEFKNDPEFVALLSEKIF